MLLTWAISRSVCPSVPSEYDAIRRGVAADTTVRAESREVTLRESE